MKAIGYFFSTVCIAAYTAALNGWGLTKLWAWFISPLGLPLLSIPAAIGIALTVSYLTHQIDTDKEPDKEEYWVKLLKSFFFVTFKVILALLMGWIVKFGV